MQDEPEMIQEEPQNQGALVDIFGEKCRAYLQWLIDLKPLSFIAVFSIHLVILKVFAALLIETITYPFSDWEPSGTVDPRKILAEKGYGYAVLLGVVFAPLVETILGQWLPIRVARFFTTRPAVLLWASTFVFAIQHLHAGFNGLAVGIGGGVVLAFAFLAWYPKGFAPAFWMTAAIHALHNGAAFLLALFLL